MAYSFQYPGIVKNDKVLSIAAGVKFLVLDVDGVCTDGKLYYQENGHAVKCFYAQDGLAIRTAQKLGIGIGVITGRNDPCAQARMMYLGVKDYFPSTESKLSTIKLIQERHGLSAMQMAYIGDDWIDLDPMRHVGMPMAVANATFQVKHEALYITAASGGNGAVREAIEFLINARPEYCNPADLWSKETGPAKI